MKFLFRLKQNTGPFFTPIKEKFKTLTELRAEVLNLKNKCQKLTEDLSRENGYYWQQRKEINELKEQEDLFGRNIAAKKEAIKKLETENQELTKKLEELQLKFTETQNELKITKANEIEFRNQLLETMKLNNQLNTRTTETTIVETESKTK